MKTWIALMGKRNTPTDGVADYCAFLGAALAKLDVKLETAHVRWNELGWDAALKELSDRAAAWRGQLVFLQYTALAWSERGFPWAVLRVVKGLRRSGARVAVVFHEYERQDARPSFIRPLRWMMQDRVIRRLCRHADLSVFSVPAEKINWLRDVYCKAAFIPIGANIPEPPETLPPEPSDASERTIAMFCFTSAFNRETEIREVATAAQAAALSGRAVHLQILGRGSDEVLPGLAKSLQDTNVRVSSTGILTAEEISNRLSRADLLLFVRGQIEQTRGSVLAGVACGLPIVGYDGRVQGTPLADAGLHLAPFRDGTKLATAVLEVLDDVNLQRELRQRSLNAHRRHFAWDAIAKAYVEACA